MGSIELGQTTEGVVKLPRDARETHLHVIGGTGSGKSAFLEHMIRRDIRHGHGVFVIDPHGTLFDNLVDWIGREGYAGDRPVHLIDGRDPAWTIGFNPLIGPNAPHVRVSAMVNAVMKAWGDADITQTPRLARSLYIIFHLLAEQQRALTEASLLTSLADEPIRRALTAMICDPYIAAEWREINDGIGRTPRAFAEFFESTRNRLQSFATSPTLRRIFGQTERLIDFGRVMDERHIVLVSLAPGKEMSPQDARMLGAMLFSALFTTALSRDPQRAKRAPCYCYIDECADYLTDDIARMLDQTRKFGLHLILAHQRLQQLRDCSETLYNGVMESAKSKVVFQVDDDDSAEILARHLFRKVFDLSETAVVDTRPTVVGYRVVERRARARGQSYATSQNWASGTVESAVSGAALSAGSSQMFDAQGHVLAGQSAFSGSSASSVTGQASSSSQGGAQAWGTSVSESVAESLEPVIEWLDVRERKSIEEHIHEGITAIRGLPQRVAYVYLRGVPAPFAMRTLDVRPARLLPTRQREALERIRQASPFMTPSATVDAAIAAREAALRTPASAGGAAGEEDEEDAFYGSLGGVVD